MYQFRDPIHGFIEVSDDELTIINSPPFQRLRNIRQLATTYLVYHGAEHTRFGHSLGVMHLTSVVFDALTQKTSDLFDTDPDKNQVKIKWYRQLLRLIGLTHDLGHAPFSHASEKLFIDGKEHEDFTKRILFETEIAGYIDAIGQEFQKTYGDGYEISAEIVWMIYEGKNILSEKYIMPDFMFLKSLMDGELDCDKMDYLLRDAYYCGTTYGRYDLARFVSTLTVHKDEGSMQLAIERGGVQALEEFVLARYFMFIQVYFHKTRRYLDHLLVQSLQCILPDGKYPEDLTAYLSWDDNRVLHELQISELPTPNDFIQRKIMTCVYESKPHAERIDGNYAKLLYKQIKPTFGEYIHYDSVDKAAHKLTPNLLASKDDSGNGIMIVDVKTNCIHNIMEESLILESIIKPISIQRIYANREIGDAVLAQIQDAQKEFD